MGSARLRARPPSQLTRTTRAQFRRLCTLLSSLHHRLAWPDLTRGAASRVVGLPPQAVRRSDLFRLEEAGGPHIVSAEVVISAARTRAACSTLSTWPCRCCPHPQRE